MISFMELLEYLLVTMTIFSAVYVALSRNLLRITVAFFLELACASGILLNLNSEYLAVVVLAIGILGTILIIISSSILMGNLKESFKDKQSPKAQRITQTVGMLLGLGVGIAIGHALINAPFIRVESSENPPTNASLVSAHRLGEMLLGHQLAVFELLSVIVLVGIIGAALLLRKAKDAN